MLNKPVNGLIYATKGIIILKFESLLEPIWPFVESYLRSLINILPLEEKRLNG
jgi:hypothetical protein